MRCETKKIEADNVQGFIIINASDFDAKKHKEFTGKKKTKKAK